MKKFTFKTEKETGKFSSFFQPIHLIKLNRSIVGEISHPEGFHPIHKISFMVMKDKNDLLKPNNNKNCNWKRIIFKAEFNSVDEAKQFIRDNNDKIQNQFNLVKE
jgi:hypothetical protein